MFRNKKILLIILVLALFFRLYKAPDYFLYSHDQDLAGWIIKDIVVDHHVRLIGQLTSTPGIFIGPYFYYFLIPFYLLFKMDPIGGTYAVALIGVFATWSCYFVFSKIFSKRTGFIASFLYATSYFIVINDREVVPLEPVIFLWTVWYFYMINLLLKGKRFGYILAGILLGYIWNLNMSLILLIPLIPISLLLSRKKLDMKGIFFGFMGFAALSLPLILFEVRHGFSQTKALLASLVTNQHDVVSGVQKLDRVILLTSKNIANLFVGDLPRITYATSVALIIVCFFAIVYYKRIGRNLAILMGIWSLGIVGFFAFYSKVLSEYYLNGAQIVWFTGFVLFVDLLLTGSRNLKRAGLVILVAITVVSMVRFFGRPLNKSGYIERKEIVSAIKEDLVKHNYPCVSVSYITDPGYNLGYRYLFWLENMHVNQPKTGSPVYSVVFPLSRVDRVDKTIGALGLIYPDYQKYNEQETAKSCSGPNENLTDTMFGFTN